LHLGVLTIDGCWSHTGSTYETAGDVTVNGITLQGGGTTTVDTHVGTVVMTGTPRWLIGGIQVAHASFSWPVRGSMTVSAGGTLKGLALQGVLSISFSTASGGTAAIGAYVGLPSSLGGVSGQTTLATSRNGGFSLTSVKIAVGEIRLGRVDLKNVQFSYQQTDAGDRWAGRGTLVLPGVPPDAPSITLAASVLNGSLESASADVDNLNRPIGGPVFLQSLHVGVVIDPFSFDGSAGLTAGPTVLGKSAVSLDGSMSYWAQTWTFNGDLAVFGRQILNGSLHLRPSGEADVNGDLNMTLGPYGVSATINGFVTSSAFDFEGEAMVRLPFAPSISGTVLVSSKGVAACAHYFVLTGGFGYTWGGPVVPMGGGCDVGPWRVPRGGVSVTGDALPRRTVVRAAIISAGLPFELFSAVGSATTPDILVHGPSGQNYDSRDGAFVNTAAEFIWHNDDNHTVYVAVRARRRARGR
jgi:hypothetical protein